MIARVYDRVAATPGLTQVMVATDDARVHAVDGAARGRRLVPDDESGPSHRHRPPRGSRAHARLRSRRQRPGRRAADRAGDDRRSARRRSTATPRSRCRRSAAGSTTTQEFQNPNLVKVVVGRDGFALYFSRAPIPYHRATGEPRRAAARLQAHRAVRLPPRDAACGWRRCRRRRSKRAESLEQLRALEHGIRIKAVETRYDSIGVDTPEDLARVAPPARARRAAESHRPCTVQSRVPSSTSSSPAASSRRSARASPPPRSAACSKATATRSRCRSSTRTSTSTRAR